MNAEPKTKRKFLTNALAVSLLLLIILFAAALRSYTLDSREYINAFSREYLHEMLALVEEACNDMFDCNYSTANGIHQYLYETTGGQSGSLDTFSVYFHSIMSAREIEDILFLQPSGHYLSIDGGQGQIHLNERMSTLFEERQRVSQYILWRSHEVKFVFATPYDEPINIGGMLYEAVALLFDLDTLSDMINIPSFQGETRLYVLDPDGTVMFSSRADGLPNHVNLLSNYVNDGFITQEAQEKMLQDFQSGSQGAQMAEKQDGSYYLVYMKMRNAPICLLLEVELEQAQDVMMAYQTSMNHYMLAIFAIILAMVVVGTLYVWQRRKVEFDAKAAYAKALQEHNTVLQQANLKIQSASAALERRNQELELAKRGAEDALRIAEEANRSKSNFLSNMSHDIRTPMNAIVGFCALLARDTDNPDKVREYTSKITTSSQHLMGLINDVLDMSKIESGKTTLNLSEENIGDLIEEIDTIVRPQMNARMHTFDVIVQDVRHECVVLDKLRLNQILLNLLSNALKYTPDGGLVTLRIQELPQRSKQFALYRFVVSDNGLGMTPEFAERIFESFTREENSVTNKIQGTGLGMAITKNLVDLMGGKISVETQKDVGSTFTVELELRLCDQEPDHAFWKKNGIARILVVDDEEVICQNAVLAMDQSGVQMDCALSGAEALAMLAQSAREERLYDIVLLDWKMPELDGLETARRIRKAYPGDRPLLILTSYDWSEIEDEARQIGIQAFLPKPFFANNFRHKVDMVLNHHGVEETPRRDVEESVLRGLHILVAEDNAINAEILSELLDIAGATCEIYENGQLAVEAFERSQPGQYDLILMDVQMPVMNGYQATRTIRNSRHPMAAAMPVIAMTANAFAEDINNALQAGMDAHVAKPVDMAVLEETVHKVLDPSWS